MKNNQLYSEEEKQGKQEPVTNKNFKIALISCILGGIAFIASFFVGEVGQYLIYASMLTELVAMMSINMQKRIGYTKACKIVNVITYVIFIAGVAVILGAFGFATNK